MIRVILDFAISRDTQTAILAVDSIIASTLHILLWLNRKRVGKNFVLYLLLLSLEINCQRMVTPYFQIKLSPELDDIQKTIILKRNLEFLKQRAIFTAMFSCPSMSYFIIMLAGFVLSMFILSFGLVGLSN